MAELLALEHVIAGYGESVVLDDVSLSMQDGTASLCSAATAWGRRRCSSR